MTWFKLHDDFTDHPKVVSAGVPAAWVHLRAMCHCSRYLTDGHVASDVARVIGATPRVADRLIDAGLWERNGDGFIVHDWLSVQRSRDEVLELKAKRAEAGSKGGKQKAKRVALAKQNPGKDVADTDTEAERTLKAGPSPNGDSSASTPTAAAVKELFEHWKQARGKSDRFTLTPARSKKIRTRLREFTVDELKRAIDGVALDPWEGRAEQDDLTLIFRNPDQVQKFLALAETRLDVTDEGAWRDRVAEFDRQRGAAGA